MATRIAPISKELGINARGAPGMFQDIKKWSIILCLSLFALALHFFGTATADMFTPSHSCHKPYRPYQFTSEYEVSNYNSEVDSYKRCIEEFVDEQKDASNHHRDAAREAIEEWNSFARTVSLR